MTESRYYNIPSPFPTLARGLFTREIPESQGEGEAAKTYQIVVRGYDKFFDIADVPWTTWSSLEAQTVAPYTLSLKLNGSSVMIAALTPSKLIVTSKNSLGPSNRREMSRAQAGEAWLRKYLENKGKTEEDLAARLWESNLTAVAELCDNSYEEYVLAYPPDKTGLYLHGLNVRSKEFKTLSTELVDAFADEWGFLKTPTVVLNSIQEVRDFTDACSKTGEWNGEGFVVRTHAAELPTSNTETGRDLTLSPYTPGSSLFFKVKFEESYVKYRDWREATEILLSSETELKPSLIPKSKMKRAETKVYVKWVIEEITKNRDAFGDFISKKKGVIATREKFLEFLKTEQGMEELERAKNEKDVPGVANKTIIVPVGIPGCGKTSVSVALAHIFGFGHVEYDDVYGHYAAFIKNVFRVLDRHDVMIADRTNHLKQHRQALLDGTSKSPDSIRLLALNWSHNQPTATIHRICSDRVEKRGDKHQYLRAVPSSKSHEDVIQMHISTNEELTPSEVDNVVEMELGESLEESVKRAVEGCVAVLGLKMPSDEKIQEGLEKVKSYVPGEKKLDDLEEKNKAAARYYRLLPEMDLKTLLDRVFANEDASNRVFWTQLKQGERVHKQPEAIIVHNATIDVHRDLWNRCAALVEMSAASPPLFKANLGHLLWNERVMVFTVDGFDVASPASGSDEARELVASLSDEVRSTMFIAAGTKGGDVRPMEAKVMVEQWRRGEQLDKIKSIKLADDMVVFGKIFYVKKRAERRRKRAVRFYSLLAELNLERLLDRTLANEDKSILDFWTQMKTDGMVQTRPHATIVHKDAIDTERDLWDRCAAVDEISKSTDIPLMFKGKLGYVLSDGRLMVVTLDDLDVANTAASGSNEARELLSNLSDDVRSRIYILAGAKDKDVLPIEAKALVGKWRRGEDQDKIKSIKVSDDMVVLGRIQGQKFGFAG